jgi:hypothetical protein
VFEHATLRGVCELGDVGPREAVAEAPNQDQLLQRGQLAHSALKVDDAHDSCIAVGPRAVVVSRGSAWGSQELAGVAEPEARAIVRPLPQMSDCLDLGGGHCLFEQWVHVGRHGAR